MEIVKADLDDKSSLIPAFKGATVIFSNTDFFQTFFAAIATGDSPSGRTPEQQAYDAEIAQGVNIAEVAASPEVLETLERFVVSTLSDATKWSGGKWKTVWHYDSKAVVISTIHEKYPELALKMSLLQIGHYVTNWKAFPRMAPLKQEDGSFLLLRPTKPETRYEFVDAAKDTGAFVKALLEVPAGKHLLGVGESLTMGEWIEIWGRVHGVKAGFKQISREEFFEGVPAPLERELGDAWGFAEEFGHYGGDPEVVRPEEVSLNFCGVGSFC